MKGLVVVICAPSQFGKDTVAEKMIQFFPEYFRGGDRGFLCNCIQS